MSASPQVSLRFRQQRRQGGMLMIARDLIVQRAKDPLDGIGLGTVTRQPEKDKTRVAGQPAADVPGGVNAVVVRHDVHTPKVRPGISAVQGPQQIEKQEAVFLVSGAVEQPARAEIQRGGKLAALVLAGRGDFQKLPTPRPLRPDFGQ
jgi:hypothetical protein